MLMKLLKNMATYMQWADREVWKLVEALSDEEFNQSFGVHGGNIRNRYIHLAKDTWEWYHDWTGKNRDPEPDFNSMSREELFHFIVKYTQLWIELINERKVNEYTIRKKNTDITIEFNEIFFHIINHITYHRGQIVMALRLLEKNVHMTDYVPYRISTTK